MTHVLVRIYFRYVPTGGTYLSALGSQQGILISASTVSHCGSTGWKNGSCSEHQCIGLLEEHCSNYIVMSLLNLQIHLQWASLRQHECGINQDKLSKSILPSVMLGWVTTFLCTSVYLCRIYIYILHTSLSLSPHTPGYACMSLWIKSGFRSRHIWIRVCEFKNKKWFSGLTVSRWPQAGGMHRLGHLFSYKWGVHCWFGVCSSAEPSFIRKYFSQHISIESTQTWYILL